MNKELPPRSTINASLTVNVARADVQAWVNFFAFMRTVEVPPDFMVARPMNMLPLDKDVFGKAW